MLYGLAIWAAWRWGAIELKTKLSSFIHNAVPCTQYAIPNTIDFGNYHKINIVVNETNRRLGSSVFFVRCFMDAYTRNASFVFYQLIIELRGIVEENHVISADLLGFRSFLGAQHTLDSFGRILILTSHNFGIIKFIITKNMDIIIFGARVSCPPQAAAASMSFSSAVFSFRSQFEQTEVQVLRALKMVTV